MVYGADEEDVEASPMGLVRSRRVANDLPHGRFRINGNFTGTVTTCTHAVELDIPLDDEVGWSAVGPMLQSFKAAAEQSVKINMMAPDGTDGYERRQRLEEALKKALLWKELESVFSAHWYFDPEDDEDCSSISTFDDPSSKVAAPRTVVRKYSVSSSRSGLDRSGSFTLDEEAELQRENLKTMLADRARDEVKEPQQLLAESLLESKRCRHLRLGWQDFDALGSWASWLCNGAWWPQRRAPLRRSSSVFSSQEGTLETAQGIVQTPPQGGFAGRGRHHSLPEVEEGEEGQENSRDSHEVSLQILERLAQEPLPVGQILVDGHFSGQLVAASHAMEVVVPVSGHVPQQLMLQAVEFLRALAFLEGTEADKEAATIWSRLMVLVSADGPEDASPRRQPADPAAFEDHAQSATAVTASSSSPGTASTALTGRQPTLASRVTSASEVDQNEEEPAHSISAVAAASSAAAAAVAAVTTRVLAAADLVQQREDDRRELRQLREQMGLLTQELTSLRGEHARMKLEASRLKASNSMLQNFLAAAEASAVQLRTAINESAGTPDLRTDSQHQVPGGASKAFAEDVKELERLVQELRHLSPGAPS